MRLNKINKLSRKTVKFGLLLIELPKVFWFNLKILVMRQKKAVLMNITTTNEFFYLKPILNSLARDRRYLIIISADRKIYSDLKKLFKTKMKLSLPIVNLFWANAFGRLNFYINATLSYDTIVPAKAKYKINLPHSIVSKSKSDIFSPVIEKMTDIFATGQAFIQDLKNYYRDNRLDNLLKIHNVGCPKSDALFSGQVNKINLLKEIGLDPDLPTVFYAPTWNQEASVYSWLEDILNLPEKFKINLIIKLHPGVYVDPDKKKVSGGVNWRNYFQSEHLRQKRIYNILNEDSTDFVKITDVAITDISTTWIEFYLTKKPIIFLDIPEFFKKYEFNSLGDVRNAYGYLVKDVGELDKIVSAIITNNLKLKNPPLIDEQLIFNRGKATSAALEIINSL